MNHNMCIDAEKLYNDKPCCLSPWYIQENILDELGEVYHMDHNMCIDVLFNLIPLFGHDKRLVEENRIVTNFLYSVMQSDGNIFCGDVFLDTFTMSYRDELCFYNAIRY